MPLRVDHHGWQLLLAMIGAGTLIRAALGSTIDPNDRKGLARAYVLVPQPDGNPVLGYYTLMSGAVAFEQIPPNLRQGLPKYPIPVARIGELAVDYRQRGQGLGSDLLLDAITRIARAYGPEMTQTQRHSSRLPRLDMLKLSDLDRDAFLKALDQPERPMPDALAKAKSRRGTLIVSGRLRFGRSLSIQSISRRRPSISTMDFRRFTTAMCSS